MMPTQAQCGNLTEIVLHVWPELEGNLPQAARAMRSWKLLDPGGAGEAVAAELLVVMIEDLRNSSDLIDKEASDLGDPSTIPAFEGIISLKDFKFCMFKLFQIGYT